MVFTRKFSQFTVGGQVQTGDIIVGYEAPPNNNTQWTFAGGSGGGGNVIATITQPNANFTIGQWVENIGGLYILAKADNAMDAEVIGVVEQIIDPTPATFTFTVQQSGYISFPALAPALPFLPLQVSTPYFLDPDFAGQMTTTEPFVNGQVSRPVFIPDSPTTGWVLPYRGYVVGGGAPVNPGITIITRTVTQIGHGFNPGDWLRTAATSEPQFPYTRAFSDTLAHAQAVGVVTEVLDLDHFILQVDGYVGPNVFLTPPLGPAPLVQGSIYYLSDVVGEEGQMTLNIPTVIGEATKPLFSADTNASGWILPQRPLENVSPGGGGTGVTWIVVQANSFQVGDWVRLNDTNPNPQYTWAQADTEQHADVIGVVQSILVPGMSFILQQAGFCQFAGLNSLRYMTPGQNYFLSPDTPGYQLYPEPFVNGQVSRPTMTAYTQTSGWVLPYRGYVIGGGAPVNPGTTIVTQHIHQVAHEFVKGNWLRTASLASPSQPYALANASAIATAYVTGVVIDVLDADNFVMQSNGYIAAITGWPYGLVQGIVMYLDPANPGLLTPVAPSSIGQAVVPCFSPDFGSSGWIIPFRPIPNTNANSNPVLQSINQTAHPFSPGDWLRTARPSEAVQPYALANSTALSTSYVVGIVIATTTNSFLLQSNGYLSASFLSGAQGFVEYLDPAHPGQLTPIVPSTVGQVIVPCFSFDSSTSGWIIPFRPILITDQNVNNIIIVTQINHLFNYGQIVANNSSSGTPNVYTLASASTLASSYFTSGMVVGIIDADHFVLQQSGYVIFSYPNVPEPPDSPTLLVGNNYWLSPSTPGSMQNSDVLSPNASRPVFQCTKAVYATNGTVEGWILPNRPIVITSSPPASGAWQLIQTTNITGMRTLDLPTIISTNSFADFLIVGRDLQFTATPAIAGVGNAYGANMNVRIYQNGIIQTGSYTLYQGNLYPPGTILHPYWSIPGIPTAAGVPYPDTYYSNNGGNLNFEFQFDGIKSATTRPTGYLETIAASQASSNFLYAAAYSTAGTNNGFNIDFRGHYTSSQLPTNGTISIYGRVS